MQTMPKMLNRHDVIWAEQPSAKGTRTQARHALEGFLYEVGRREYEPTKTAKAHRLE